MSKSELSVALMMARMVSMDSTGNLPFADSPLSITASAPSHSVLLFVSPPGAGQDGKPLKTLAGFARVSGFPAQVSLPLTAFDLSLVGVDGKRHALAGEWKATAGIPSSPAAGPSQAASISIQ